MCLLFVGACASNGSSSNGRQLQRGAVVCEHPLATAVGLRILEGGGNAADAAVATAFALAVVYPQAGNLGGGGFALWVPAEGAPRALDFREVAPSSALVSRYLDAEGVAVPERSQRGPLSVGVPGSPSGLFELHKQCGSGRYSFAELVEPAVRLARDGFEVDPWLAFHLHQQAEHPKWNSAARDLFYPDGQALQAGARFVQPELADTLERLATGGPDAFYTGGVAAAVVRELDALVQAGSTARDGGSIELADLAEYRPAWRDPLRGWFQGHELISMPPPSSGGLVVMQTLAVLEGLPLAVELAHSPDGTPTVRMVHWWIEALRGSFADRAEHLGDPDHVAVPMQQLLSPAWIAQRRANIGERARADVLPWSPPVESTETTHLSIVDRRGNALSMTTTLNSSFGSGILVSGAGFLLNNELDDFAIQADAPNIYGLLGSSANLIAPGKRPLSSMTPTVVRSADGRVELVLGSPGGPNIITSVVQVLVRVLVMQSDLRTAVDAPRLHQQWSPIQTQFESEFHGGWDELTLAGLEAREHPIELIDRRLGSVQAISIDAHGMPQAYSDPRRGGAGGVERSGVAEPATAPLIDVP